MAVWMSMCRRSVLQLCNSLPLRTQPVFCDFSAEYTKKSAEDILNIGKPKRPVTRFFKFVKEIRPRIVAENPSSSTSEIIKIISQQWHKLGDDVKQRFNNEYKKEMEQYKISIERYRSALSKEKKNEINRVRREMLVAKQKKIIRAELEKLGRPIQPMSSYLLFCQEHLNLFKGYNILEFQEIVMKKWYALSKNEKSIWIEKAKTLHEDYRGQLALWEEEMIKAGNDDFVRIQKLKQKMKLQKATVSS